MGTLSLADKAGFIGVGRFLRTVSKLLFALILVRLISKYDFGTYRQVFLLYNLLSVIFFLGIPTSIYYFLPQLENNQQKQFIIQSELFLFFMGLLLGGVFLAGSELIGKSFSNPDLPGYLKLFAFYPLLDFPVQTLPPMLICLDKHKQSAVVNVIFVFTFLFSLVIPLLAGGTLTHAFISLIGVSAVQLILVLVYIIRLIGGVPRIFDFKMIKNQLKYSIPLGFSGFATLISRELDKLVISFFFLPQVFAVYAIGARELPFVTIIPYAVSSTLFPKFVLLYKQKQRQELINLWHNAITKVSIILLPLFSIFFVTANEVVTVLYTSGYVESVPVFRYYLLLILIHVTAFDSLILSLGFPRIVLIASLSAILLNTVFNVLCIHLFGFVGPAIATIVVSYGITIFFIRVILTKLGVSWQQVFPWRKYLHILGISVVTGLLVWPINSLQWSPFLKLMLVAAIYFGFYFLLLKLFRVVSKSDVEFLKRWISLKVLSHS